MSTRANTSEGYIPTVQVQERERSPLATLLLLYNNNNNDNNYYYYYVVVTVVTQTYTMDPP